MNLSDISVHSWIQEHKIKTERGEPLSFRDHMFLFDIYSDMSPLQVLMKPAQIGASTMQNIKPFWVMDKMGVDVIYTLPTDSDVVDFVGGKTNRLIAQNPILQSLTRDRDTIEQKQVGKNMIYYRGTWTKKAAMMMPCDILIHDELDASKQQIVEDYETRVKHSKFKWRWYFSHPSTEGTGVHKYWLLSDQKHWFVRCQGCQKRQYLSWPESIDEERQMYVCKYCNHEITDDDRRRGEWVKKYDNKEFSGYWISSLMCPWVPAKEIIKNFHEKDAEYFATKVLGIPYVGGGNKVLEEDIIKNLTERVNDQSGRIVIGVDTGIDIRFVCGNQNGIFYYGQCSDYDELEGFLKRWPQAVIVIDQGGDIIGSRKLRERFPGRVFLCHYSQDRKTMQLIRWGEKEEAGNVIVDRNRAIQLVIDEFKDKRIPLHGTKEDWYDYWLHWSHIYRTKEEDGLGVMRYKWVRSDRDDWVHATVYWRVGMDRFGTQPGSFVGNKRIFSDPAGIVTREGFVHSLPSFGTKRKDWRE